MRVIVLGGTRFIGRALVAELVGAGHKVLVVHRGLHEPDAPLSVPHLHLDRRDLPASREAFGEFQGDAVADLSAMTREDAEGALTELGEDLRWIVASSIDVYRAFSAVWEGSVTDPVPLTEESPLRDRPPPDATYVPDGWDYDPARQDKVEVERVYPAQDATVCRLPMVYGQHDYKRREEFVLRRVRAGRTRIPIGAGGWLWSRGYVASRVACGLLWSRTPWARFSTWPSVPAARLVCG